MADRPLFIRLSMPSGLEDALEGLAREVLRSQPKDMLEFSAQYFEGLLRTRNKEQDLPEDDLYGLLGHNGYQADDPDEPDDELEPTHFDDDIKKVQTASKIDIDLHMDIKTTKETTHITHETIESRVTKHTKEVKESDYETTEEVEEEFDIDLEDPETTKAATKIQAGFRGSKARKEVGSLRQERIDIDDGDDVKKSIDIKMSVADEKDTANEEGIDEEIDIDMEDPETALAATKIQASFRGSQARKEVEKLKQTEENIETKETAQEVEEVIDIDLEDPETEKAATKIQASFRGSQARKEVKTMKETDVIETTQEVEEVIDIDLDDPETAKAATKIQASFRGSQARKEVSSMKQTDVQVKEQIESTQEVAEDVIDIDLDDPETEKAATKIQAGFRGSKARKEVNIMKETIEQTEEKTNTNQEIEEVIDIDLNDPETEKAATKIQAGFRGSQARKEVHMMKESGQTIEKHETIIQHTSEKTIVTQEIEEVIDIDLNDPETEKAATKIQAGFRGSQARKEVKMMKEEETTQEVEEVIDIDLDDPETAKAATKIQASFRGSQARKEVKTMKEPHQETTQEVEEVIDIDLDDPETAKAATKIQASFRGSQARKEVKTMMETDDKETTQETEEVIDIDLDDPETAKAATKIQASFRGSQARKEVKTMKETEEEVVKDEEEEFDIDLDDPETAKAATKIQAGFRGSKARKEVHSMQHEQKTEAIDTKTENQEVEDGKAVTKEFDPNDPKVDDAATKIQSGYKGMKSRQGSKVEDENEKTEEDVKEAKEDIEEIDIDLNDPEVEMAATKIQAGYKGLKTRKEMREKNQEQNVDEKGEVTSKTEEEEEVIDIDLDDPETAKAATKIQASFRGSQARKEVKTMKETDDKEAIQDVEEVIDIDLDDPETAKAATKIQASFRGSQARKEVQHLKDEKPLDAERDPNDPDVHDAATKIQGGYRSMKSRETIKNQKEEQVTEEAKEEEEIDIDLNDPDVEMAATKIQAGYKGMRTRKEMKEKTKNDEQETIQEVEQVEEETKETEDIDIDLNDPDTEKAATKIQAGYKGMRARKEVKLRKKEYEEDQAATKLQAGYRGMKVRKDMKEKKSALGEIEEFGDEEKEEEEGDTEEMETKKEPGDDPPEEEITTEMLIHGSADEAQDQDFRPASHQTTGDDGYTSPDLTLTLNSSVPGSPNKSSAMGRSSAASNLKLKGMAAPIHDNQSIDTMMSQESVTDSELLEMNIDFPTLEEARPFMLSDVLREELLEDNDNASSKLSSILTVANADEIQAIEDEASTTLETNTETVINASEFDSQSILNSPERNPETVDNTSEIDSKSVLNSPETNQETVVNASEINSQSVLNSPERNLETVVNSPASNAETVVSAPEINPETVDNSPEKKTESVLNSPKSNVETVINSSEINSETVVNSPVNNPETVINSQEVIQESVVNAPEINPETVANSPESNAETVVNAPVSNPETVIKSQEVIQETVVNAPEIIPETVANSPESNAETVVNAPATIQEALVNDDLERFKRKPANRQTDKDCDEPCMENIMDQIEVNVNIQVKMGDERQESREVVVDKPDPLPLDQPEEVETVGAVPFEDHQGHEQVRELNKTVADECSEISKEKDKKEQIMLYYSKGSYTSEKVLVYLYERGIDFTSFNVDLSKGEQFSKWFLKINPKAEVPVLTIKDPSRDPRDPRYLKILTDSTRIMHSIDAKFTDLPAPNLVPSSSDTLAYQHHVYFTAIFDQIPLNIISHGIAFHDHLAIEPESPYYEANYEAIRDMVLNREEILNEAAIGYAAFIGSDTDNAVMELRKKASAHKHAMYQYTNFDEYKKLIKRTAATLDKAEAQLKKSMADNSEDDCEGWLLNVGFGVVDIILGVLLQRLAKLGLRHYFWSHGKRPFIHKFIRQIQQRPSFIRAIKKLPLSEISGPKPKLLTDSSMESRISLDEMDAFVRVEPSVNVPKKPPPLKMAKTKSVESMEIYNTLRQCNIEDEKADGTFVKKRSNWKQLWVSDEDEKEDKK